VTVEMGLARAIDAETFGQPGQRTFRLRIAGESGDSASLWMEKEQFQALSMAMTQILTQLGHTAEIESASVYDFPDIAEYDFRVGRTAIGIDPVDGAVILQVHETGADEDDEPTLRVRVNRDDCAVLNARLRAIIVAGRPVCPLCGSAIDPTGHMCIRTNGHSDQPIPELGLEEEDEE
jgi:uncharacterized repeat protein (TIGR03847 family)